jgi:hypothetical protein
VNGICLEIKTALQLDRFSCIRSDTITSAGVIHPEIWQQIKRADVIVADVSGQNGNVMLELGVAAAWREKDQVIILREENPDEKYLFDINPARHIEYARTASGFEVLKNKLRETMFDALAAASFEDIPAAGSSQFPSVASLHNGQDCADLWVPSTSHRRMLKDCLEFGSLYSFPRSWLAIGNVKLRNVSVRAELQFTERRETQSICWMGINLRSQTFYANTGHLVLLRSDGSVARTARTEDPTTHHDVELGKLNGYDPGTFVQFALAFDDQAWDITVGSVKSRVPVQEMPFVFSAGRMLIQTYMSRAGVRNLEVRAL